MTIVMIIIIMIMMTAIMLNILNYGCQPVTYREGDIHSAVLKELYEYELHEQYLRQVIDTMVTVVMMVLVITILHMYKDDVVKNWPVKGFLQMELVRKRGGDGSVVEAAINVQTSQV